MWGPGISLIVLEPTPRLGNHCGLGASSLRFRRPCNGFFCTTSLRGLLRGSEYLLELWGRASESPRGEGLAGITLQASGLWEPQSPLQHLHENLSLPAGWAGVLGSSQVVPHTSQDWQPLSRGPHQG